MFKASAFTRTSYSVVKERSTLVPRADEILSSLTDSQIFRGTGTVLSFNFSADGRYLYFSSLAIPAESELEAEPESVGCRAKGRGATSKSQAGGERLGVFLEFGED